MVLHPPSAQISLALVLRDVRRRLPILHCQCLSGINLGTPLQEGPSQRVRHELRCGQVWGDQLTLLLSHLRDSEPQLLLIDIHEANWVLRAKHGQGVSHVHQLGRAEWYGCLRRRRRRWLRSQPPRSRRRFLGGARRDDRGPPRCPRLRPALCPDHVHCLHGEELQISFLGQSQPPQHAHTSGELLLADAPNLHRDLTQNPQVQVMVLVPRRSE
mmetsp:Transcript_85243/g.244767  ORF Transcript_85243/g.244767 Transcript_85243/m.244767 type:complete len:214 (-) Transcript_85243:1341-1982(-)